MLLLLIYAAVYSANSWKRLRLLRLLRGRVTRVLCIKLNVLCHGDISAVKFRLQKNANAPDSELARIIGKQEQGPNKWAEPFIIFG